MNASPSSATKESDSCARLDSRAPLDEAKHLSGLADQCESIGQHLLDDLFYTNDQGFVESKAQIRINERLEDVSIVFRQFIAEVRLRIGRTA